MLLEYLRIKTLKDDELLPDLSGVKVRFAGFIPTHMICNAHWRKLQSFLKGYAKEAGDESVAM